MTETAVPTATSNSPSAMRFVTDEPEHYSSLNEAAWLHAIAEVESGDNYDAPDNNGHYGKYQVSKDIIRQYASASQEWVILFSTDHEYQDYVAKWWLHHLETTHSTQDPAALYRLWNPGASADTVTRVTNLYEKFNPSQP